MEGIQFDGEEALVRQRPLAVRMQSGITAWLIRNKIVKTDQQAQWLLLGVLVFCVVVTVYLLGVAFSGGGTLTAEERRQLEQSTPRAPR
ncbi:MAG TPA: hypothetical protein PK609_03365 [Candidatus Paceibacterota bacterium]|jgi:hypothetical protein|nr:hypothetical protein [Candidatus Paceibacterota bacterium]